MIIFRGVHTPELALQDLLLFLLVCKKKTHTAKEHENHSYLSFSPEILIRRKGNRQEEKRRKKRTKKKKVEERRKEIYVKKLAFPQSNLSFPSSQLMNRRKTRKNFSSFFLSLFFSLRNLLRRERILFRKERDKTFSFSFSLLS